MVKLGEFQPVTRSDVPDIPDWAERVLAVVNDHLLHLTQALQKKLNLVDNWNGESRTLKVRHGTVVDVKLTAATKGKARKVTVLRSDPSYYFDWKWENLDSTTVRLTVIFSRNGTFSDDPPLGDISVDLDVEGSS